MENENDSLARTAHVFGMTDIEFEQRAQLESELAAQQVIRARMELEAQEEAEVDEFEDMMALPSECRTAPQDGTM